MKKSLDNRKNEQYIIRALTKKWTDNGMGERHLCYQIKMLSNLIFREMQKEDREEEEEITPAQGWVIGYLYENRGRNVLQRELGEQFHLRRSTVTEMLKLMEKRGYLLRVPSDEDARMKCLRLTEKAVKQHERVVARIRALEERVAKGFTEEELDTLFGQFERIKQNLSAENG